MWSNKIFQSLIPSPKTAALLCIAGGATYYSYYYWTKNKIEIKPIIIIEEDENKISFNTNIKITTKESENIMGKPKKNNTTETNKPLTNESKAETKQREYDQRLEINNQEVQEYVVPKISEINDLEVEEYVIVQSEINNQEVEEYVIVESEINDLEVEEYVIVESEINNQEVEEYVIVESEINNQKVQESVVPKKPEDNDLEVEEYVIVESEINNQKVQESVVPKRPETNDQNPKLSKEQINQLNNAINELDLSNETKEKTYKQSLLS